MLVVHVYSRELPVLPGPWEDAVASPCLTRPGPRVSRAVSHWAHCFSRSTGSTLSLPQTVNPTPVSYALSMVLVLPPQKEALQEL